MSSTRRSSRGSGAFVTGRRAVGRRLWVLGGLLTVPLIAVFVRLVQWQWIEHDRWRTKAENNTRRLHPTPASRGDIRFRDGSLAAGEQPVFAVQVIAGDVCPPDELHAAVAEQLGVTTEQARLLLRRRRPAAQTAAREARRAAWRRTCAALVAAANGVRAQRQAPAAVVVAGPPRPGADPTNPFRAGRSPAAPVAAQAAAESPVPGLEAGDLHGRAAGLEAEAVHRLGREWARIVGLALRPHGVPTPLTTARTAAASGDAHHAGWIAQAGSAVLLPDPAPERLRDLAGARRRALTGLLDRAGAAGVLQQREVKNALRDADRVFDRYLRKSLLNRPLELLPQVEARTILSIEVRPGDPLPGVRVVARGRRVYPFGPVACHLLGYVGVPVERRQADGSVLDEYAEREAAGFWWDALSGILDRSDYERLEQIGAFRGEPIGRTGIERARDVWLSGRYGLRITERDAKGRLREALLDVPAVPGAPVRLTIDPAAQRIAQQVLAATVQRVRGSAIARGQETSEEPGTRGAAAVVLDVHTGEVLVCASVPTFDPNHLVPPVAAAVAAKLYGKDSPFAQAKPALNRAIQGRYPPGSVLKVIPAIGLMHAGSAAGAVFRCDGEWSAPNDRRVLTCMHRCGTLTLEGALQHSCNVVFYEAGFRLGSERLVNLGRRMGLGVPTACGLPFESGGTLPDGANAVQTAIGQGRVLATPMQIARLYAAIANGGRLVVPRLTLGETVPAAPQVAEMTPGVLDRVRAGLRAVVDQPGGTAYAAARELDYAPGLRIAGKTGTADKPPGPWNVLWFAGYAPHHAPRYAVAVVVERVPHGMYAGAIAFPAAARILQAVLDPAPEGDE